MSIAYSAYPTQPSRSIRDQPLVPTVQSKTGRDWGKYESGELPDLNLLLQRTLHAIEQSHNHRERSGRSFDALWKKVCRSLESKNNATRFEHWKRAALIKNGEKIKRLNDAVNIAWAQLFTTEELSPGQRLKRISAYEAAEQALAEEKPRAQVTTDDILEFAIAYWIEAKNARDSLDDGRCLHALIECWTHIGATMSPKTESEAKSHAGAKQGKALRDSIAAAAADVLLAMPVKREMADPSFLWGGVVRQMQHDPAHAKTLKAYDRHVTKGRRVQDTIDDRLVETLMRWTRGSNPSYPGLAAAHQRVLAKVKALTRTSRK